MTIRTLCLLASLALALTGCCHLQREQTAPGQAGHLLVIGGAIKDDNTAAYERFVALARASAGGRPPRVLIATAASAEEAAAGEGKAKTVRRYCPDCQVDVISRDTTEAETLRLVDGAQAIFFTGGDQKRVTTRYRPEGAFGPEAAAMRRLLARGGVIAGTSAGDAMMSDPMFLTGRSAEALGVRSMRTVRGADDDEDDAHFLPPLGPQIGPGMGLLAWAMTDSHFFERDRFGRLVAALEASRTRLGLGVGENGCVDVDLATGEAVEFGPGHALLVNIGSMKREGLNRRGVRAMVLADGVRVSLRERLRTDPTNTPSRPLQTSDYPPASPGAAGGRRPVVSLGFFRAAAGMETPTAYTLLLDGYRQVGWPDGKGGAVVDIEVLERPMAGDRSN